MTCGPIMVKICSKGSLSFASVRSVCPMSHSSGAAALRGRCKTQPWHAARNDAMRNGKMLCPVPSVRKQISLRLHAKHDRHDWLRLRRRTAVVAPDVKDCGAADLRVLSPRESSFSSISNIFCSMPREAPKPRARWAAARQRDRASLDTAVHGDAHYVALCGDPSYCGLVAETARLIKEYGCAASHSNGNIWIKKPCCAAIAICRS